MQWFEIIIALVAFILVIGPIITHFIKKKKGTLKCECGHYQSECVGNCTNCQIHNYESKKSSHAKLTYSIILNGMKCGMCESHVNNIIRREFNVISVKSSRKKGRTIIVSKNIVNLVKLKKLLIDSGYEVLSIKLL